MVSSGSSGQAPVNNNVSGSAVAKNAASIGINRRRAGKISRRSASPMRPL